MAQRLGRMASTLLAHDWIVLGGLLAVAAATRLPGLAARGDFNGDQGHDVLTLLRFVRDGTFPLLGPTTSVGNFHHGDFYYLLLAPAAAISGSDPVAVVTAIALMGIAAVGVAWWLARTIAGPVAGLIAGGLLALSPAAIDESIFIWNPNPIPLFAGIALAAAWRARQTGHARWWVLALGCAGAVFQLHVLGVVFLPPILALLAVEIRSARRRGDRPAAQRLLWAGLAGLAVIALLFVPLLVHELRGDWSEIRNALAYFTSSSPAPGQLALPARLAFTLLRVVGWPLVGLVTDAPLGAAVGLAMVLALGIWAARVGRGEERVAVLWLGGTVIWSAIALAVLAPSLQTVVAGLPNDHYHAFLDPVVVVLLGVSTVVTARALTARASASAAPAAASGGAGGGASRNAGPLAVNGVVAAGLALVAGLGISHWPAATDPNGGWPAARAAGERIVATTRTTPVVLYDIPDFKTPDGIGFPIVYAGGSIDGASSTTADYVVVPCDRLFESIVGAACGGPAEDALVQRLASAAGTPVPRLVDRFDASVRTAVSVYQP